MVKKVFVHFILFSLLAKADAQLCTFPGQTPVTATFVCSSQPLIINTPTFCGQTNVPVPCNDGAIYQNINPDFFRFNCYNAGTLGFIIIPNEATANYNWQLFDITNTNPFDIFTNRNLFVACNWSSEPGETGATIDGLNISVCSGSGQLPFSKMPDIRAGRTYLLMVCNQSSSASGYQLLFEGGNAVITDGIDPHLLTANLNCDRTQINIRLNKSVKCSTIATDGSDFVIPGGSNVISAVPGDCTTEFGTGSITLALNQPLAFGNFNLIIKTGNDNNTLVDICNRSIPIDESVLLISIPAQLTIMDSIINTVCNPTFIDLVFKQPILCSSIAADGSDFVISGPQAVSGIPVFSQCTASYSTLVIRLNLSVPLISGTYQVRLVSGSDGNTILNECRAATPEGSTVSFNAASAVSAIFTKSNSLSCSESTVSFLHDGGNNVNLWQWDFGNGTNSTTPNPVVTFRTGQYNVKLTVSNGVCTSTSTQLVNISTEFKASFKVPPVTCPGDSLRIENNSTGNIDSWNWNFGNGMTSTLQTPAGYSYAGNAREIFYIIRLIISNSSAGCNDTIRHVVKVLNNCFIAVPSAFTPNGDGNNDYLYPLNALKANNLDFKVYNRTGQLVFATKDWTKKWDGTIKGAPQDSGIYVWLLSFIHQDTGEKKMMKGTTLLLR